MLCGKNFIPPKISRVRRVKSSMTPYQGGGPHRRYPRAQNAPKLPKKQPQITHDGPNLPFHMPILQISI